MKITCISDMHGDHPKLPSGDLLIVAGDWTLSDTLSECFDFFEWVDEQKYKKKIVIAGNHDNKANKENYQGPIGKVSGSFEYLCDSGTEFQHLKIWGSPWTKTFKGMNSNCKAFTVDTDEELSEKWSLIPKDIDILVTHSPPFGILDKVCNRRSANSSVGSKSLKDTVIKINPKLHVFGHIHESFGKQTDILGLQTIFVNASRMDENYDPVNGAIRVEI